MKIFFAVDRTDFLKEGKIISLAKYNDITPIELQRHVDDMFPEGLSHHGDRYFLTNNSVGTIASPAIELLFEYVRRAHFPTAISRFQSFFACETEAEAVSFKNIYGSSTDSIYEIYTNNNYMKVNMNLLINNNTTLVCSHFAHEYWSGSSSTLPNPFWEMLLELPIRIGKKL